MTRWWPGGESNTRHADFQSDVRELLALYFNKLPGRPLPNLHHNAQHCTAHSRKTHAKLTHDFDFKPGGGSNFDAGLHSELLNDSAPSDVLVELPRSYHSSIRFDQKAVHPGLKLVNYSSPARSFKTASGALIKVSDTGTIIGRSLSAIVQ